MMTLFGVEDCATISSVVTQPFVVTEVTYHSDVSLSPSEFYYLVDIAVDQCVTADMLTNAIVCLFQKHLFQKIILSITDDGEGKHLHFELIGAYIFQALKIGGIWINREQYKEQYLMEPGDVFDRDKHVHSIKLLKEVCNAEGFFDAHFKDKLVYDKKTKSVRVSIVIERGDRFVMDGMSLTVCSEHVSSSERAVIEKALLKKFISPMKNRKYSKGFINQQTSAMRQYLINEGFSQNNILLSETRSAQAKSVRLTWRVDVGKKRAFIFFGNRLFSHSQLLEYLLKFGRSSCIIPSTILLDELKSAYHDKGFLDVEIDARDEEGRSFFVIKEGQQSFIDSVEIKGVVSVPQTILLKHCFPSLRNNRLFDRDVVNTACGKIVDWYASKGFFDVKIVSHMLIPLSPLHYKLLFTIHEGECTTISDVVIPGYRHLENEGPFCLLKQVGSIPSSAAAIHEQERWLTDYFRRRGYLFVSVRSELTVHDEKPVIIWHITPGCLVRFGKTIIQGNNGILFPFIMRELKYKEEEPWDQEKIRLSFTRLKDLQLFDTVSFVPVVGEDLSIRPILLRLNKEEPFEVRMRTGVELQHIRHYASLAGFTYKFGGTFIVKSPLCCGDQFRVDVDVARSHNEIVACYRYPWLFSLPMYGQFQMYKYVCGQPGFIGSEGQLYRVFRLGTSVELRRKFEHVAIGGNIGFEWEKIKLTDAASSISLQLAHIMNFDESLLGRNIPFIFIEPNIVVNLLDNVLNPTRGTFSMLSLRGMFSTQAEFTNSYFVKLLLENSCFIPLGPIIAALRVRYGHIFHRSFSDIVPTDRFYIGGAHTVRSYGTDLTPPFGCFINKLGKRILVPQGGKTMFNLNVELRFPILKNLGIVLFQDFGLLAGDNLSDKSFEHVAAGSGIGVRYLTPMGPFRFDIAWKWKKHTPDEHRYNWFLTFGQAF